MRWYRELYVSESVGRHAKKLKWKINHNAGTIDTYVITIASNPDNMLDIIPTYQLLQKAYPKKDMYIIGLARGYYDALELTTSIIQEVYDNTGDVDVRSYIKSVGGMG